jgi:hypothetical protein
MWKTMQDMNKKYSKGINRLKKNQTEILKVKNSIAKLKNSD